MNDKPSDSSRTFSGWDYFLLWAGAAIALPEIWAGGLLTAQGLLLGLAAIILGHVIGNAILAAAGRIGARDGVPAIASTRPTLGRAGAHLAGALNVIQLLGWTGFMIWIAAQSAQALPWLPSWGPKVWTLLIGILTTLWAAGGRAVWRPLQRIGVLLLLALSVWMTVEVLRAYPIANLLQVPRDSSKPFLLALDAVIVMPVSWLPLVSDYTRYARRERTAASGVFWGYFIGSCWMYAVGLVAALATQSDTPDAMVIQLLGASPVAALALVVILLSTFTTTFLDIFSTAVSAQSLWPRLPERATILVVGLLGTLLAMWVDAMTYEPFLLFIGSAFCPLFGVVLADYFLIRRGAPVAERFANPRALAAWAAGFALYQAITRLGWPIGASLPAFLLAAGLHLLLHWKPRHD